MLTRVADTRYAALWTKDGMWTKEYGGTILPYLIYSRRLQSSLDLCFLRISIITDTSSFSTTTTGFLS
jgi:hypothetical protein